MSLFKFEFNWKLTLFTVVLLPLLVSLGLWQMQRAEEKRVLKDKWTQEQSLPPISFSPNQQSDFRRVILHGEFLPEKYWLKENQMLNGQLGYHVIMPFKLSDFEHIVAVDRGWIEGSPLREFVPDVKTPSGEIVVTGALVVPSDSKLIREADVRAKTWPHKILEEDLPVLSKQLGRTLYPQLLRIDPDSQGALTVYWRPINMSPAKHLGYAVQWFGMALALIILYICASTNIVQLLRKQ